MLMKSVIHRQHDQGDLTPSEENQGLVYQRLCYLALLWYSPPSTCLFGQSWSRCFVAICRSRVRPSWDSL
ncbi:hypothetical protein PGTUg99_033798 [Puccinia graminis f. sp. tritici]|uniref:Uncharacterized protein n=1 Tax=Puccinia graminis f. sp. tritici TaxID=56615 RepID=A0A5B0QVT1_PUCGR|nr:hypothetical protein PGTUg99_033798 [Puccinia graminis f. sp. tritici]